MKRARKQLAGCTRPHAPGVEEARSQQAPSVLLEACRAATAARCFRGPRGDRPTTPRLPLACGEAFPACLHLSQAYWRPSGKKRLERPALEHLLASTSGASLSRAVASRAGRHQETHDEQGDLEPKRRANRKYPCQRYQCGLDHKLHAPQLDCDTSPPLPRPKTRDHRRAAPVVWLRRPAARHPLPTAGCSFSQRTFAFGCMEPQPNAAMDGSESLLS